MNKWNFKNLFTRKDNLLSVLTVCIAIIVVSLDIFTDVLTNQGMFEAILIVLTLLAVTNIIERETRFYQTDLKIDDIITKIEQIKEPFFIRTDDTPKIREYSAAATEIFCVGGNLAGHISKNLNFFENWLREGKALKFIIQNPHNEGLKHLDMPAFHYSYESYVKQIEISLDRLKYLKEIPNANIQVRLSNVSPTQTISILNGHIGGSLIYVALHLPYGDAGTRPCFFLKKEEHKEWFDLFYKRYYESLWIESEKFL